MKRSIEFDLRGNSLGGGVGKVRLYHVRERGSGEAKVGWIPLSRNVWEREGERQVEIV